MWQRIFALMLKEFLAVLKDKRSRFVLIGPPLIQILVFGYAATFDLNRVPYAVYDEDGGESARELLSAFSGSETFSERAPIRHQAEIAARIDDGELLLVLHVGPRFSETLLRGDSAQLQAVIDGRNSNTALILVNYVNGIVRSFNETWAKTHGLRGPPALLETRAWFNPNLQSRWFIVPGIIGLLMLVVVMVVTALSVAREREQGTFDQLLVTPMRPMEVLMGKALPGLIIGVAEATAILLIARYWFGIPLVGSIAALYLGIVLFLLSALGVGLMISSFAVTQQQGLLGAFLFMVPAVTLSGFATPIANMPPAVQLITLIDPLRYFMVIIRGVFLEATPFHVLAHQFWPLALIGVTTLSVATWLFRHRMY